MTKFKLKIKHAVLAVAVIVIVFVGTLWYRDYLRFASVRSPGDNNEDVGTFTTIVERDMPQELEDRYKQQIDELITKIESDAQKKDFGVYLQLGNAYYALGELGEADVWYKKILSELPNDTPALENLGQVHLEMGDYAGAETYWARAVENGGQEAYALKLVDLINEFIPEHREPIRDVLEVAIKKNGQSPSLLSYLAEWYAERGLYEEAVSHYTVALTLLPDDEQIQNRIEELRAMWSKAQGIQ